MSEVNPAVSKEGGEPVYIVYVDQHGDIDAQAGACADVPVPDHGYASVESVECSNSTNSGFAEPTQEEKLKLVEDLAGPHIDGRITFGAKKAERNKSILQSIESIDQDKVDKLILDLRKSRRAYRTPAGPVLFSCNFCDAKFSREQSLYGHLTCHKGEAFFKCSDLDCGLVFESLAAFKKHSREHSNWRPYRCELCGLAFDRPSQLNYHVDRNHERKKDHTCKICGKEFFKRSDLKQHLNLHLGIKKHTCETCGHTFSHVSNLNRHKRTHTREKPYVCFECGKRFSQTSSLNNHAQIHATKILAQCPGCPKKFKTGKLLLKHLREIHFYSDEDVAKVAQNSILFSPKKVFLNGEEKSTKNFYCPVCGKQFAFTSELKNHVRSIHEKETGFECKSCAQNFSKLKHLIGHSCVNEVEKVEKIDKNVVPKVSEQTEDNAKENALYDNDESNPESECRIPLYSNEVDVRVDYDGSHGTNKDTFENVNAGKSVGDSCVEGENVDEVVRYDDTQVVAFVPQHELHDGGHDVVSVQYSVINGENTLEVVVENEHSNDVFIEEQSVPEESLEQQSVEDEDAPDNVEEVKSSDKEKIHQVVTHTEHMCDESGEIITKQVTIISIGNSQDSAEDVINDLAPAREQFTGDDDESVDKQDSFVVEFFTDTGNALETIELSNSATYHVTQDGVIEIEKVEDGGETKNELVYSEQQYRDNFQNKDHAITCNICDRTFTRVTSLNSHMGMHLSEKRKYECKKCGERFAWKSTLNRHDEKVHANKPKTWLKCKICDKTYLSANLLTNHVKRDHENERRNKCKKCGKVFYKKHDLKVHLRTHFGIKPYMCSTCGKEFSHSSHIIRHERTHSGVKPYKCDKCPKAFTQSGTLKFHIAKHISQDFK